MSTTVNTVLGPLDLSQMGVTLTHEHLWMDTTRIYFKSYGEEKMSDEKITRENRQEIVKDLHTIVFGYKDNIIFNDVDLMIEELSHFKAAGGQTIFEVSTLDLGRNPLRLQEISRKAGINIVMGGTFYYYPSIDSEIQQLIETKGAPALANLMIREFYEGVGDTGIRPGVLGELGLQHGPTDEILAEAALIAQKETHAPLIVHSAPYWILDMAERIGSDMEKIVMGHWTAEYPVREAIERGAWVSFDQFGMNFPGIIGDDRRIEDVLSVFEAGLDHHLLLSQDTCWKVRLRHFGGDGYAHLLTDILPHLQKLGIPKDALDRIMIDNPARLLS